jgi:hypothetical protein
VDRTADAGTLTRGDAVAAEVLLYMLTYAARYRALCSAASLHFHHEVKLMRSHPPCGDATAFQVLLYMLDTCCNLGFAAFLQVQKVTDAVQLIKEARPDLMVEGPLQYDAAIDPAVASVKIKTASQVAGRATVFVFPDLNTGNNTYKAVQQVCSCAGLVPWGFLF